MPTVSGTLDLPRCPRCGIAKPLLNRQWGWKGPRRYWATYLCTVCAEIVLASADSEHDTLRECLPFANTVSEHIPQRAAAYLRQAQDSLAQPAGSLMLSASAVDAMLKAKDLRDGSLYQRIEKAATAH